MFSISINKKNLKLKDKIGTLDLETYGNNLGLGCYQVFAGGWSILNNKNKFKTQLFYINKNETSEQFIIRIFKSILINKNLNGYTFYVHILGRFYSIFIIKALILSDKFSITPVWKDNSILSLIVKYNDFEIILLDSLLLIPGTLNNILIFLNYDINKEHFPYSFVNKDNLYYIGSKPSIEHYTNISNSDYQNIPDNNWNLEQETLNYLKLDVEGLLEALTKFNKNIFSKYQLDITKYKTLPSLVLAAYTSNYIPNHLISELKMIKGDLEREIRNAYFGGNVDVFINKITNGYLYDINSQYSKAMLNDMPIGDPVLSLETNLNNIFGFVYG